MNFCYYASRFHDQLQSFENADFFDKNFDLCVNENAFFSRRLCKHSTHHWTLVWNFLNFEFLFIECDFSFL